MNETEQKTSFRPVLLNSENESAYLTVLLYVLVGIMAALLLFTSFVGVCEVDGSSMNPGLNHKDNVLVLRNPGTIKRRDVITVISPEIDKITGKNLVFIKRVVAVGGDTVKFMIIDAQKNEVGLFLKRAGETEFSIVSEKSDILEPMYYSPFIFKEPALNDEYEVPDGFVYVMGDNRNDSSDSRKYGAFSLESVTSKQFYRLRRNSLLEAFILFIY